MIKISLCLPGSFSAAPPGLQLNSIQNSTRSSSQRGLQLHVHPVSTVFKMNTKIWYLKPDDGSQQIFHINSCTLAQEIKNINALHQGKKEAPQGMSTR